MLINFQNTRLDDDPQRWSSEASKSNSTAEDFGNRKRRRRRRRRKMDIPHGPLAQGYASLDTGAPCVKEQSCAATAATTPERTLANQTAGCMLRQKDMGPPRLLTLVLIQWRRLESTTTGAETRGDFDLIIRKETICVILRSCTEALWIVARILQSRRWMMRSVTASLWRRWWAGGGGWVLFQESAMSFCFWFVLSWIMRVVRVASRWCGTYRSGVCCGWCFQPSLSLHSFAGF